MKTRTGMSLFFSAAFLVSCGGPAPQSKTVEKWNSANDPLVFSNSYIRKYDSLPSSGRVPQEKMPWVDSYWPAYLGGIAQRWRIGQNGFDYKPLSLARLKTLSAGQIASLSPAEKYDIFTRQYNYPTVAFERRRNAKTDAGWVGICDGWAAVSMLYKEPRPVTVKNPDGISIPFASSDVKALLSLYQSRIANAPFKFLGYRCNADLVKNPGLADSDACRDINAGSFHVVLTNELGLRKKGFIADVTRGFQVWNQPVYGYAMNFLSQRGRSVGAAPGTVKEILVQVNMKYAIETNPNWYALNNTNGYAGTQKYYRYWIELNSANDVIGGTWETNQRPDFLWTQDKVAFTGAYAKIGEVYNASIGVQRSDDRATTTTVSAAAE